MSALKPLPRNEWRADQPSPDVLDQLVFACLERLASMARETVSPDRLSQREWQVANLVVCGNSNRQIAHELMLSARTVDTHVSHILRKLELTSRAQIAAWVVERRPRVRLLT